MSAPSAEATPGELLMVSSPESVIGVRAGADTLPLGHSLKKAHVDSAAGSPGVALGNPSKVVYFWSLPPDVTEAELSTLCQPYGTAMKVLLMHVKHQAFVELDNIASAEALVREYTSRQMVLRGHRLAVSFSTRDHVDIKDGGSASDAPPSSVLHVRISEFVYPVTVDTMEKAFGTFGRLNRVVTFAKGSDGLALVEFASVEDAAKAKEAVDGKYLYSGCNKLHVTFSKLTSLTVRFNNDKSRDFTNPSLPTDAPVAATPAGYGYPVGVAPAGRGYGGAGGYGGYPGGGVVGVHPGIAPTPRTAMSPYGVPMGPVSSPVLIVSGYESARVTPYHLFILFGAFGDVIKVKKLFAKQDHALVEFMVPDQAELARANLNGATLFGWKLRVNVSTKGEVRIHASDCVEPALGGDFTTSPLHRFTSGRHTKHICPPSQQLHVSNLPVTFTNEALMALIQPYGTVVSVKAIPSALEKPNTRQVIVAMSSVDEATTVLVLLHNFKVEDRYIRISFSRAA